MDDIQAETGLSILQWALVVANESFNLFKLVE